MKALHQVGEDETGKTMTRIHPLRDTSTLAPEKVRPRICARCIYDDQRVARIEFDDAGVCSYCRMIEDLKHQYGTGTAEGAAALGKIITEIKVAGRGKKYDCVVGISGGTDSSFLVHWAVQQGLRPLAAHYDNTWNTAVATENIRKVLGKLKVDLYTHVVDNREADDIFRSFFLANAPGIDAPTDIALAEVMYRAADKYGIKYVLEGHSFLAEGVSPLGASYVDGKLVKCIHHKFGVVRMKTFPNMTFLSFLKWILVKRIRKIRPFWYSTISRKRPGTC